MSIWQQKVDLETLNGMCKSGLAGHLQIQFTKVEDDGLQAIMPVSEEHKQPLGLLHGGATAALAETMGSIASVLATSGERPSAVGVELNINHLRSATEGVVTGICRPIKVGRSIHVWAIDIFDHLGQQISVSRLTTTVKNMA